MVLKVKKIGDSQKVKQIDEAAKKYAGKPDEKAAAIEKIMQGISELTGDMESEAEDTGEQTNVCPHCGESLD